MTDVLSEVDWQQSLKSIPIRHSLLTGENELERRLPADPGARRGRAVHRAGETVHRLHGIGRGKLIGAAAGVVVVLIVASVLTFGGSHDASPPAAKTPRARSASIIDTFKRGDSAASLGSTETGQSWQMVSGTWGIADGAARVVRPAPKGPSMAIVQMGSGDGFVQVTEKVAAPQTGLIFRYRDPLNFWSLRAVPRLSTWTVIRVEGGKAKTVGNAGLAKAEGATVAVRLQGQRIEVLLNGVLTRTFDDSALQGATGVGLFNGVGAGTQARWVDFLATPQRQRPPTSPSSTQPKAPTPAAPTARP